MKVLVTGDREWRDRGVMLREMSRLPQGTAVIQGGASGADRMAWSIANAIGLPVTTYQADWLQYGKSAGPKRNQQMLDEEHRPEEPIDLVLAFHDHIESSKGTKDMVERARKAGIEVKLITTEEKGAGIPTR